MTPKLKVTGRSIVREAAEVGSSAFAEPRNQAPLPYCQAELDIRGFHIGMKDALLRRTDQGLGKLTSDCYRIAQGPIPVDDAIAIARQVAEALIGAHRTFVHCDLKPANIKHLYHAVRPELDIRRFQIAMNDALLMRTDQGLGNLTSDC